MSKRPHTRANTDNDAPAAKRRRYNTRSTHSSSAIISDGSTRTHATVEVSPEKENALRIAAKNGQIDDVKELIEGGVNPNAADEVCC